MKLSKEEYDLIRRALSVYMAQLVLVRSTMLKEFYRADATMDEWRASSALEKRIMTTQERTARRAAVLAKVSETELELR
jgi:hypothetical protein